MYIETCQPNLVDIFSNLKCSDVTWLKKQYIKINESRIHLVSKIKVKTEKLDFE